MFAATLSPTLITAPRPLLQLLGVALAGIGLPCGLVGTLLLLMADPKNEKHDHA
jgi:hypothetical protein